MMPHTVAQRIKKSICVASVEDTRVFVVHMHERSCALQNKKILNTAKILNIAENKMKRIVLLIGMCIPCATTFAQNKESAIAPAQQVECFADLTWDHAELVGHIGGQRKQHEIH